MNRFLPILIFVFSTLCLCSCDSTHQTEILGVKCYELPDSPENTIARWNNLGINTAYVSEDIAENLEFRKLAKASGIDVYLIFPVFYNPEALKADSSLWARTSDGERAKADWVEFVCPSRKDYRASVVEHAKDMVSTLKPDGLSIDFIRHFVFWEMVGPNFDPNRLPDACCCSNCIDGFITETGMALSNEMYSSEEKLWFIQENHSQQWQKYKERLITTMVSDLAQAVKSIKPDTKLNLHAVPWRADDYNGASRTVTCQNLPELSKMVDYISPMCYTHMLYRSAEWVDSLVVDFQKQGVDNVLPCIQVGLSYRSEEFTPEAFDACVTSARKSQVNGLVLWSWEMLAKDLKKQKSIEGIK
ncbi:hypothetical protein [Carboxylicivirga sp. N1Y90]|uniref:hypothetical protein n=1 Tax=Carboxylicivirga fragile TaxID=3417571 RepID=UPI003D324EFC|nr:hypothetical protein [Marinilabiliaceae bacterium N1Y90]